MSGRETADAPSERQVGGTHYLAMSIQPWDVIDTWPHEQRVGFYRGTAMAYLMRAGSKGDAVGRDFAKLATAIRNLAGEE